MKKVIVGVITLFWLSALARADMVKHEYTESVNGAIDCKMPVDPAKPTKFDCIVKKGVYETGVKFERRGDLCSETTHKLVALRTMRSGNREIQLPEINVTTTMQKCQDKIGM